MSPFSFLSIQIVGTNIVITLVLLFGVWRALLAAGKTPDKVLAIVSSLGFALFGWLGIAFFFAWQGTFRSAVGQPVPYIALAIGAPILVGTFLLFRWKKVQEIIAVVPQSWLVGFQFYRIIGVTFLVLHAAGQLPGIFALPAGYGDLFVGLTALLVGTAYAQNHARRDQLVTLWNWFGIADLVIALATGFLSSPSRFQLFSLDAPNFLIGSFPLVMIPIYAVPLSIVLHLASLTKMRRQEPATAGEIGPASI